MNVWRKNRTYAVEYVLSITGSGLWSFRLFLGQCTGKVHSPWHRQMRTYKSGFRWSIWPRTVVHCTRVTNSVAVQVQFVCLCKITCYRSIIITCFFNPFTSCKYSMRSDWRLDPDPTKNPGSGTITLWLRSMSGRQSIRYDRETECTRKFRRLLFFYIKKSWPFCVNPLTTIAESYSDLPEIFTSDALYF